ncbi:MAG: YggS family pyridoxal phosphate-dependent enzyme, partial [Candidatus Acidiferrales bacterium]
LERVQERIRVSLERAGRRDEVTLVAVTKLVPPERIAEAYRIGLRHFGENRVQEFDDKRRWLTLPAAVWHLVGHLQSNKARRAAALFDCLDSLDSSHVAEKLSAAAREVGRRLPDLIQVKLGAESGKAGVEPAALPTLVEQVAALNGLTVKGLMTLPPYLEPAEQVRPYFRRLRELAAELDQRRFPGVEMRELSMGMSHDFEIAIEEGATQVRLGTAIFGERPGR